MMYDMPPLIDSLLDGLRAPFTRNFDVTHAHPAPGWTLDVSTDRFTGKSQCAVRARSLTYQNGVVTVHFSRGMDTANALFRIDGAPARSVGEVAVEAAGKGAPFLTHNTSNPTNGEVHIPTSQLEGHQSLAVRPNLKAAARVFDLSGLAPSLAAAEAKGCPKV